MSGLNSPGTAFGNAKRAARAFLARAGILSFFVNILMLTGPLYMLQIYDRVLASRSYETLLVITGLILSLFAAMALIDLSRSALLARAGEKFEADLKDLTFNVSMDAARSGSPLAEQPLRDLRQIRQFVASPALTAVFDAPWTPLFLAIVFMMHWLLGVVAVIGLIILLSLALYNERSSRLANETAQGATGAADKLAQAALRNSAAADAMGMREKLRAHWRGLADRANSSALTATDRIGGLTAISKATRLFLQSAILGTGAFLAINGAVTPGVMIAASIITGRALAPVEIVTSQWKNFALTATAYNRFEKVLAAASDQPSRTELPAPTGAVAVHRLTCQPGNARRPVLKNISFDLTAGEALGVIGPSAAGKSTLARALVGVERALAGEVSLDAARLDQWDRSELGKFIGFLPQEVELFAGTAAQNIARFDEEAVDGDIIEAARAAGAHEMILAFDDGYNTEIGERGAHLSAGQRQRLGLARALYGKPVLVVLDEPNANLDGEGDAALAEALRSLKARGATSVIIAHRPAAIASVDKLMLLADGEVRAFGPRDEILRQIAPREVTPINRAAAAESRGRPA